ncbi:MAG TPA: nucleotidyl transferase AbiEii/AbiGii toxin family protein [Candidatus Paceibacterota bacterium]
MHPEAITSKQKEILKKLPIPPDFYLVGGTALALQIGHRISVDFDFFTSKQIPSNILDLLQKIFGVNEVEVVLNVSYQLTTRISGVEVTYFRYPFPPLFPFIPYDKMKLLSIAEIAASKAHTIGRRATRKDYVDLYFIFKEKHANLQEIIGIAQKKYKEEFDPRLFLEQLLYLEDVPVTPITFLKEEPDHDEILLFFETIIKKVKM